MNEIDQLLDANNFRDEKIIGLTLLGYSMSRVSTELEISRNTVRSVLKSQWGQERLNEAYQNIDHALISLPELVAISLTKLKTLINQDEATRFRNIEAKKFELEAVKVALNLATKVREMQSNVLINSVATLD